MLVFRECPSRFWFLWFPNRPNALLAIPGCWLRGSDPSYLKFALWCLCAAAGMIGVWIVFAFLQLILSYPIPDLRAGFRVFVQRNNGQHTFWESNLPPRHARVLISMALL